MNESFLQPDANRSKRTTPSNLQRANTFQGFTRAMTTTAMSILPDPENAWFKDKVNDYARVNSKAAVDGDVPLPGGFAGELR